MAPPTRLPDQPATTEAAQYRNISLLVGVVDHRDCVHEERNAQPAVPMKLLSAWL
jgi:hypothetical protein